MNILLFIVNYKTDDLLARLIQSVAVASRACPSVTVEIHVQDNSEKQSADKNRLQESLNAIHRVHVHFPSANEGYFGGLELAQSLVRNEMDAVMYCNADLLLAKDFFSALSGYTNTPLGVLAPSIRSVTTGVDQNPMYRHRLAKSKLVRLRLLHSSIWGYRAYHLMAVLRERLFPLSKHSTDVETPPCPIYAPHGSAFVFTDIPFFLNLPKFPCFLYGEELFVAEEARRHGVMILYTPKLKLSHVRHASMPLLGADHRRHLVLRSLLFILERYYPATRSRLT